jgi:hypothetical protein
MRKLVAGAAVAIAMSCAPAGAHAADAVVALMDTGINPYHKVFRDSSPRALEHPSTYLAGYPAGAQPLNLTLTAKDYATAYRKDCAIWKGLKRGQLYYVPGTRIVGAISFQYTGPVTCPTSSTGNPTGTPFVLDTGGHGTMTASRAVSSEYGACRTCLVVAVQYQNSVPIVPDESASAEKVALDGLDWLHANAGWIDAESHSWGPIAFGAWDPTSQADLFVASPELARTTERNGKTHPTFFASGNGVAGRGGVIGLPGTVTAPQLGPSVISVGGHDSGYVSPWPGFPPTVVSDDCNDWAAYHNSTDKSDPTVGSGTSSATPFASGGAVRILRDAREILGDTTTGVHGGVVASGPAGLVPAPSPLADGKLTVTEWKDLVLKTATRRPVAQMEDGPICDVTAAPYHAAPVKWSDVPDEFPEYVQIGYGAVDEPAHTTALKVLRGEAPLPDRSATDQFMALDNAARTQLHTVFTLGSPGKR